MPTTERTAGRIRRHERVRERVGGTQAKPRLVVFRSLAHIYAQVIDDRAGRTLASASDQGAEKAKKSDRAKQVGRSVAERAKAAGISEVVFDRGGYRYHGRVKALADAAREAGLRF